RRSLIRVAAVHLQVGFQPICATHPKVQNAPSPANGCCLLHPCAGCRHPFSTYLVPMHHRAVSAHGQHSPLLPSHASPIRWSIHTVYAALAAVPPPALHFDDLKHLSAHRLTTAQVGLPVPPRLPPAVVDRR